MKTKKKFIIRMDRNDELERPLSEIQVSVSGKSFIDAIKRVFNDKSIKNFVSNGQSLMLCINTVNHKNQLSLFADDYK